MQTLSLPFPILVRRAISGEVKVISRILFIFLISSILWFLGFYLFQIGDLTRSEFLIKNYRLEIERVCEQNLLLKTQSMSPFSLAGVEEKIKDLNFVEVKAIKYIPVSASHLVKKTQ